MNFDGQSGARAVIYRPELRRGSGGGAAREHAVARPARRTRRTALRFACALLLPAALGCDRGGEPLRPERTIPLPAPVDAGATLSVDARGTLWIAHRGGLMLLEPDSGRPVARVPLAGLDSAVFLRNDSTAVFLRSRAGALSTHDPRSGQLRARRPAGGGSLAVDPRGRWIYSTVRNGGVLGLDARTLQPQWGWPESGRAATALAVAPLGDRVYLALAGDEDEGVSPSIRVLDAQTGEALLEMDQELPVRQLIASTEGWIFGRSEEDGAGAVFALRHHGGELQPIWSLSLRRLGLGAGAELRVAPGGARVAVLSRGEAAGIAVLDGHTGAVLERTEKPPLSAAFDGRGRLLLLDSGAIGVVR